MCFEKINFVIRYKNFKHRTDPFLYYYSPPNSTPVKRTAYYVFPIVVRKKKSFVHIYFFSWASFSTIYYFLDETS